jgi:hypothetical protein
MTRIHLSRDLAAAGFSPDDLTRMTRAGDLVHLRRGAYAEPVDHDLAPRLLHLRLVRATLPQCGPGAIVSHTSAAAIHDLPVWREHLDRVHLTRDRRGGGRTRRWVRVHGAPLSEADVVETGGLRVTSLARTVVDLGCSVPLVQAVAAGDLVLTRIDRREVERVLGRQAGRTGIGRARQAVALLDPLSESAGESFSRVVFHQAALPAPELQFSVMTSGGRFVGRCDFGWPEFGVLGEFDGKKKYGELLRQPGQTAEDVLIEEKRREDRLRALGWVVIRWMWSDLVHPEPLLARLQNAFASGQRIG